MQIIKKQKDVLCIEITERQLMLACRAIAEMLEALEADELRVRTGFSLAEVEDQQVAFSELLHIARTREDFAT